jgi:DNA-binding MarR family transcriptional regulator
MDGLDPTIHAPARLQLMTLLAAVTEAEFATLRDRLVVSDSVLSKHISALVDAGYVKSRKAVRAGRRTTWVALTASGRKALRTHIKALRSIIAAVDSVALEDDVEQHDVAAADGPQVSRSVR